MTRGAADLVQMQLTGVDDAPSRCNSKAIRRAQAEKHGLPQRQRALTHWTAAPLPLSSSIIAVKNPLPMSTLRSMAQQLLSKMSRDGQGGPGAELVTQGWTGRTWSGTSDTGMDREDLERN